MTRWLQSWRVRLRNLVRRRALEREMDAEMRFHVEQEVAERVARGVPREEATRAARVALGNVPILRDAARDAWGWSWLDDFVRDVRLSVRLLRRSPAFTLTAIATLALGIGANSAMFSLTNAILLRPLYDRPEQVAGVYSRSTAPPGEYRAFSYPAYADLRDAAGSFVSLSASVALTEAAVGEGGVTRRAVVSAVTANYFDTFGRPPALGRSFSPGEERPGANLRVAVISHGRWERLGRDPQVVGRTLRVNGHPFTIVGVAPSGFTGPTITGPDVWIPLGALDGLSRAAGAGGSQRTLDRSAHALLLAGRLRSDVPRSAAAADLDAIARRLQEAFPATDGDHTFEMAPLSRIHSEVSPATNAEAALLTTTLTAAALAVLLVACLNLAGLLVARGHTRRREMAIRLSLGGGRRRLVRQLITEGVILAAAGGVLGLLVSAWTTRALLSSLDAILPGAVSLVVPEIDWRVVTGTFVFCLIALVAFGAGPAWTITRPGGTATLPRAAGGERAATPGRSGFGHRLAAGQVALSLALLAAGGLFVMSALSAGTFDPGFALEGGLLVEVDPGLAGYDDARERETYGAFLDRVRATAGIDAASVASTVPLGGYQRLPVIPAGGDPAAADPAMARYTIVGRDYFRTLGLPPLRGRDFTGAEEASRGSALAAIVSDALARRLWPGEDALGREIRFAAGPGQFGPVVQIVGVVPDVPYRLSDSQPPWHVYVPLGQAPFLTGTGMFLHARIADPPADGERAMLRAVTDALQSVDDRVPILGSRTWRDHRDMSIHVWVYRTGAKVFSGFAGLALLLTAIGVYGVKAYAVSRRTREFGVRMAIGATPREVRWLVLREGGRTAAIGLGLGLVLAVAIGLLLQRLLYGVRAIEPAVLIAAPVVLLAASLLASYVPARRATKVHPAVALRDE